MPIGESSSPSGFELREPASRAIVLETLWRSRSGLSFHLGSAAVAGRVIARPRGSELVVRLDGAAAPGHAAATCVLHGVPFLLCGSLARREPMAVAAHGTSGETQLTFSAPRVYAMDRRTATRVPLRADANRLRVLCGQPSRDAELRDVSPFGLSVDADSFTGLAVGETVAGELTLQSHSIPVVLELMRRSRGRIGFRLATSERADLARAYVKERFPQLVPRAEIDATLLVGLLRDSGYAELRAAECNHAEWQRFAARESFDYVYQTRRGHPIGHVSGTRVYKRTWLAHQLATLGGHPESGECRATLYEFVSALPHLMDGERAYWLAYFNPQKRWHEIFLRDFNCWVNDAAASAICEWDAFEIAAPAAPSSSSLRSELELGPVEANELSAATALARSSLPSLMADALDLCPERLSCSALNGDPRRARHAVGVRASGRLLGVVLCETGPKQASLFNLLNMAQLFAGDAPLAAARALLPAVRDFYRQRGVERPLLLCPPHTFDAAQEPSLRFRERMAAAVHGGTGLLQYENYCRVQMGRLFRRKDRNRDGKTAIERAAR